MSVVLIANRGEIAVRVARAAAGLGWETVAVYAQDDATSLHVRRADRAVALEGVGPAAYMDIAQLLEVARREGCGWIHPGVGFLSERAAFARRCASAGIGFVGPEAEVLEALGDKVAARKLVTSLGIPVLDSVAVTSTRGEAHAFLEALEEGQQAVVKAVAGGGGRGMRVVQDAASFDAVVAQCQAEALAAFGDGSLFLERYVPQARHVEVQLLGDGQEVEHLWTRECSLQRRFQKLVELAPAPWLSPALETKLLEAALTLGRAKVFCGLITVEFLVDPTGGFFFLEVNPRLQVEHTVTEEVTGVDLVQTQLQLLAGARLGELGLSQPSAPRGFALQARVNMETLQADGSILPSGGTLTHFAMPTGPGVRVDTMGYVGYTPSMAYDALLAKVIVHSRAPAPKAVFAMAYEVLCETYIAGIETNLPLLQALLSHPGLRQGQLSTTFVDGHRADWLREQVHPVRHFVDASGAVTASRGDGAALPVYGEDEAILSRIDGTVSSVEVAVGERIRRGQSLFVLSAMKMEHVREAPCDGLVREVLVEVGETVRSGQALLLFMEEEGRAEAEEADEAIELEAIRPDLAALLARQAQKLDAARPEAVEKRHRRGGRTARENLADLCDEGSFVEYGGLALAAQRGARDVESLIKRTPADGIVVGVATINRDLFGETATRCAVLSYDYTVFAGTQGFQGHRKTDRILQVAHEGRLPVVFFTEGGGGRPNDTDLLDVVISGLECASFREFAALRGLVPLIGINHGRCFAGNAALLGCCDVIIATKASNIGMGGPAMIEGGGLGSYPPEAIGPIEAQVANGVVDIVVEDEAQAVATAKRLLSYFQGRLASWRASDARLLRHVVPENRLRVYDVHRVVELLADTGSVMELQPDYTQGMLIALARIEGHPVGIIANNPAVLAGAIDTACAQKACRMMQLCEQFSLPLVLLCDTPGFMVGPEAEESGTVRAAAAMFVAAAKLTVPFATVVLRKGYGLGAQAMAGGHFKAPRFLVSWPTGEFGPMGLEGAVKLGFKRQLEAIDTPEEREEMFQQMVAMLYERGKALNIASHFEIDDVIDPAQTRHWLRTILPQ